jgi:hypothetical protein
MYPSHHLLLLARQEHTRDLLQEVAQMRLAKKARPRHQLLAWLDALSLRRKGGRSPRNLPADPVILGEGCCT